MGIYISVAQQKRADKIDRLKRYYSSDRPEIYALDPNVDESPDWKSMTDEQVFKHLQAQLMASDRESVTLQGRLVGMGRDMACRVIAVKVSLRGTDDYYYVRPTIHDTPPDLPAGLYTITFGGKTQNVQRQREAWIAPIAR